MLYTYSTARAEPPSRALARRIDPGRPGAELPLPPCVAALRGGDGDAPAAARDPQAVNLKTRGRQKRSYHRFRVATTVLMPVLPGEAEQQEDGEEGEEAGPSATRYEEGDASTDDRHVGDSAHGEMKPPEHLREEQDRGMLVRASHILVKFDGSARPSSWRDPEGTAIGQRSRADATTILTRLRDELLDLTGQQRADRFAAMARDVSDCGSGREEMGGDLGELVLTEMAADIAAVFENGLEVGEVSEVVETESGLHIVLRTGLHDSVSADREDRSGAQNDWLQDGLTTIAEERPRSWQHCNSTTKSATKYAAPKCTSSIRRAEEAKLRRLFEEADLDGSGSLQLKEVKALCKRMGDRISTVAIEEGFYRMDPEKTGKVDFDSFRKWWRLKEDTARRDLRKNVEQIFRMTDADGSGKLDREEVGLLAAKIAKKFAGASFDPPFNLDTDFAAMGGERKGYVTFEEFASWFKFRTGDDEPDIPVLPEYMVRKVGDLSTQIKHVDVLTTSYGKRQNDKENNERTQSVAIRHMDRSRSQRRRGKDLWGFLAPRLNILVALQNQWGRVSDLYGTGGSMFESVSAMWPTSSTRCISCAPTCVRVRLLAECNSGGALRPGFELRNVVGRDAVHSIALHCLYHTTADRFCSGGATTVFGILR